MSQVAPPPRAPPPSLAEEEEEEEEWEDAGYEGGDELDSDWDSDWDFGENTPFEDRGDGDGGGGIDGFRRLRIEMWLEGQRQQPPVGLEACGGRAAADAHAWDSSWQAGDGRFWGAASDDDNNNNNNRDSARGCCHCMSHAGANNAHQAQTAVPGANNHHTAQNAAPDSTWPARVAAACSRPSPPQPSPPPPYSSAAPSAPTAPAPPSAKVPAAWSLPWTPQSPILPLSSPSNAAGIEHARGGIHLRTLAGERLPPSQEEVVSITQLDWRSARCRRAGVAFMTAFFGVVYVLYVFVIPFVGWLCSKPR